MLACTAQNILTAISLCISFLFVNTIKMTSQRCTKYCCPHLGRDEPHTFSTHQVVMGYYIISHYTRLWQVKMYIFLRQDYIRKKDICCFLKQLFENSKIMTHLKCACSQLCEFSCVCVCLPQGTPRQPSPCRGDCMCPLIF